MPNRYVCDVLDELRELPKNLNFAPLVGMVEEVQTLVNRMEASLFDKSDIRDISKELRRLKLEKRQLESDVEEAKIQLGEIKCKIKEKKLKEKRKKNDNSLPGEGKEPHA